MQLSRLRVFQYRNIEQDEIRPSAGTNLFSGRNGQGKTNLLEAIYMLGYGKSFRTALPRECIQHGKNECVIEGRVRIGEMDRELKILISREDKKLFLHGKPIGIDEFIGTLHITAFAQKHLDVIRGGPAERRAFLDRAMLTLYPGHVRRLAAYARALKQRNKILAGLRDSRQKGIDQTLDIWDETLLREGTQIIWNRIRYVREMQKTLPMALFGPEELTIRYLSTVAAPESEVKDIASQFETRLSEQRKRDESTGVTSVGPHRDELQLLLNGKSLADFGSSGQQRSGLLSLYFSQMEIHKKSHGFYPVFLLDDVEAELDEQRLKILIEYLSERTQTFLTSAKIPTIISTCCSPLRFEVEFGKVRMI